MQVLLLALLGATVARAAEVVPAAPLPFVGVVATGEAIPGEAIAANFHAASIGADAFGVVPLPRRIEAKLSFGYRRLGGTTAEEWLWYAPVSAKVGVALPYGRLTALAAVGPSLVVWGATAAADPSAGASGGNWGVEAEAGGRVATSLVQHSLHDPDRGLVGIDGIVLLGVRWSDVHDAAREGCTTERACGFNFSALRLSAGATMRF